MNKDFIVLPEFANRLDGGALSILNGMTDMPKTSICFYISQFVHQSLKNNTLLAVLISNHYPLLERFGLPSGAVNADGTMKDDPFAATSYSNVTKSYYILINSKYFLGQEQPAEKYGRDNKEWRPAFAHELSHFVNHGTEIFPDTLKPTKDIFFDVRQAEKAAKQFNQSVWDAVRTCCGELACRFINWYLWEEIYSLDKKTVLFPNAVSFFNRAVNEIKKFAFNGYDHTGYLAWLHEEDLKDDGIRLPMQTALFLENVGYKYDLFDRYMTPPLRAKNMFLEAANAFRLDSSIYNKKLSDIMYGGYGLN